MYAKELNHTYAQIWGKKKGHSLAIEYWKGLAVEFYITKEWRSFLWLCTDFLDCQMSQGLLNKSKRIGSKSVENEHTDNHELVKVEWCGSHDSKTKLFENFCYLSITLAASRNKTIYAGCRKMCFALQSLTKWEQIIRMVITFSESRNETLSSPC